MKYKEPPYIKLNGTEMDVQEVPIRSRKKTCSSLFRKQASISCEVLNRIGHENAMNSNYQSDSNLDAHQNLPTTNVLSVHDPGEKPGARLVRNSFSCGAAREGSSELAITSIVAKQNNGELLNIYEVLHEYIGEREDELTLHSSDTIRLLTTETGEKDWWYGELEETGMKGLFPSQYVNFIGIEAKKIASSEIEEVANNQWLGQGAFAKVIRVKYNNKEAALKTPTRNEYLRILKKEAIMINRFKHHNIVELYGISLSSPHGLVLELCEGGSLKELLQELNKNKTFLSVRVFVEWAIQISNAMKFVIENHCIHRDLKTANILIKEKICLCETTSQYLDEDSSRCVDCNNTPLSKISLKLTDFGFTKALREEEKRQSHNEAGTLAYLAPEAFSKRQFSEASDVWSFGVILWSIITKEEPYKGLELSGAFEVAKNGGSALIVNEECPNQWKNIMLSCWAMPCSRPKFSALYNSFCNYRTTLEVDKITIDEERTVHLAQQVVAEFVRQNENKSEMACSLESKLHALCILYLDRASTIMDKNEKIPGVPFQQPRTRKKISKSSIGSPEGDLRHLVSVVDNVAYKKNAENILILKKGGTPEDSKTLRNGLHMGRLQGAHSSSTPHLNLLGVDGGHGTLKRAHAMKKKKKNGGSGPEPEFAVVEVVGDDDIASSSSSKTASSTVVYSPDGSSVSNNEKDRQKYSNSLSRGTVAKVPTRPAPRIPAPVQTREISLSETVPSPGNIRFDSDDNYIPISQPVSSIRSRSHTLDPNIHSMSPPTYPAPSPYYTISAVVPPSNRPAGQDEDPYVDCGEIPPGVNRIVNNDNYMHPTVASSHSAVTNPHYIYCNPDRSAARRPTTLESRTIGTVNSSAYVSMASLDNQVPQIVAPPPPTQSAISPPAIPPREGTVGLPPVRQVAS